MASALDDAPWVIADGALELVHAENRGAAFSVLRDLPRGPRVAFFGAVAIAFSIGVGVALARGRGGRLFVVGAPLLVAGALGNAIDRITRGTVTDFVHVHWDGVFDYPVWNLADAWIFLGVAMLLVDSARAPEPPRTTREGAAVV